MLFPHLDVTRACRRLLRRAWAVGVLFCASAAVGQIELNLSLEHRAYLLGEPFAAKVRLQNELDVPLVFDDDYRNGELFVELLHSKSAGIPDASRQPVSRATVVMPGNSKIELVEITSLFNLVQAGGYSLRIGVKYEGDTYLSPPVGFDLVQGIEMQTVRRRLSGYRDIDLEYSLRYWKRMKGEQAFLVIRSSHDDSAIYGTFLLGPVVRVTPPAIKFDSQEKVIVVHQSGRNRFSRSVFEVDSGGASFIEQTHHLEDGRPYPGRPGTARKSVDREQKGQE